MVRKNIGIILLSSRELFRNYPEVSVKTASNTAELLRSAKENMDFDAVIISLPPSSTADFISESVKLISEYNLPVLFLSDPQILKDNQLPVCTVLPEDCPEIIIYQNIISRLKEKQNHYEEIREPEKDRELFNLFLEFNPSYVFF